jgi:hypothetical protein
MIAFDDLLAKLPGTRGTKIFITAVSIVGLCAVPAFGLHKSKKEKQGEDLFSSDRPESIRGGQERMRKDARQAREAKKVQQQS